MNKRTFVRLYGTIIFWALIFLAFFKILNQKLEISFGEKSKEFRVELKDVNISYYFYGFGERECDKSSNVLIATLSRPNAFGTRMAIRTSWKKDIVATSTHKFFIGTVADERIKDALKKESKKFGDIIFTSLTDSYLNLTLKMNSLYQYQQYYCPKVDYFLRADEDSVLDASRFQYWLDKEFKSISKSLNEMVIFGYLFHNNTVFRNPNERWYVPYEGYNHSHYPDYVQGPCYLATSKAIKAILKETKKHLHITVDDAFYTGIIREAAGITVYDASKFFSYGNPLNPLNSNPLTHWNHECDEDGVPLLFSIVDDDGEIEAVQGGYAKYLRMLKDAGSSCLNKDIKNL